MAPYVFRKIGRTRIRISVSATVWCLK